MAPPDPEAPDDSAELMAELSAAVGIPPKGVVAAVCAPAAPAPPAEALESAPAGRPPVRRCVVLRLVEAEPGAI